MNESLSHDNPPGFDSESWEREHPVEIPSTISQWIKQCKIEGADPDLSEERWKELNEAHRKKMSGSSDEDLYYQLHIYRNMLAQGDDGVRIQIHKLEQSLRTCWCGSGKKFKSCHGA